MIHHRLGLGLGLFLLIIGMLLQGVYRPDRIPTELVTVWRSPQQALIGRLYQPELSPPYATVMLWHGMSSTKEMMEPLAVELARHGIAALAVDAGGFGESYARPYSREENLADARAIATYVFEHPNQFDPERIGIGGYSMGAATAIFLATADVRIKTTLSLGMTADVSRVAPSNLLMGIGLYEEFHSPRALRTMLEQATGEPPQVGQQYGDFGNGTARKLVISATADHLMEPFDPQLIRESVDWAQRSLLASQARIPLGSLIMPRFITGWVLTGLGSLLTVAYLCRNWADSRISPRFIALFWVGINLLLLLLEMMGAIPSRSAATLMLLSAGCLPISTFAHQHRDRLTPTLCLTGLYLVVIVIAYASVLILLRVPELLTHPAYGLSIPNFIISLPITLLYSRVYEWRSVFFSSYSQTLMPTGWLGLLFLPELICPGCLINRGSILATFIVQWLRQPFTLHWTKPSGRSLQLIGGLTVVLIVVIAYQFQSGLVSWDAIQSTTRIVLPLMILPMSLIVVMVRSPVLKRLEQRCTLDNHSL